VPDTRQSSIMQTDELGKEVVRRQMPLPKCSCLSLQYAHMLHKKLAEVVEGRCLEVVLGASVGGDNRVAVGLVDLVEFSLPVALVEYVS